MIISLQQAYVGETLTVSQIQGSHESRMRLVHLGIIPGISICILNRSTENVLVRVRDSRFMLDTATAGRIQVFQSDLRRMVK